MNQARSRLVIAAHKVNCDRIQHQSRLDELYLAAIAFAESLGYEKEEEPITTRKTYDLVDTFNDKSVWRCKGCGRRIVSDGNFPLDDHNCAEPGHWTTPPLLGNIDRSEA